MMRPSNRPQYPSAFRRLHTPMMRPSNTPFVPRRPLNTPFLFGFIALLLFCWVALLACDTLPAQESLTESTHESASDASTESASTELSVDRPSEASPTETTPDPFPPEDTPETIQDSSNETTESSNEIATETTEKIIPETTPTEETANDMPDQPTGPQRIQWASLQWPPVVTVYAQQTSRPIYGQFYAQGYTDQQKGQPLPRASVEIGYGPLDSDPRNQPSTWRWSTQTTFHKSTGLQDNNHEYKATLTIPQAGHYHYTFRYRLEDGPWFYGDRADYGRLGSQDGFSPKDMGVIAVVQSGARFRMASFNLHCLVEQPEKRLQAIADAIATEQIDFLSLQEVCRPQASAIPDSAARLATLLQQKGLPYTSFFSQTHVGQHDGASFDEGIGFLSRYPVIETQALPIPPNHTPPAGACPRKAAWGRLATPVGILSLRSTHLAFRSA
ncbi:hypothetical protein L6R29_17665, partial [Myxococcota bacterium]|nr:hypothetical protein [Myxococcota bacterium]